jgi:solute carrier family 50 (sugar transporter)
MLTAAQIILEYICPICGMITGNLMFFAPYADARQAALTKYALGNDLNPTPWAFMLGNCFGWVTYGILLHNYFVFFANVFGFVLSIWLNMVAVKLQYCNHRSREMMRSMNGVMLKKRQQHESIKNHLLQQQEACKKKKNDDHAIINDDGDGEKLENDCVDVLIEKNGHTSTSTTAITEQVKEFDATRNNSSPSTSAIEYEQLVWKITLEAATPAPAPQERLVMGMVLFWTCIIAIIALFGSGPTFSAQTRQLLVGIAVNLNLVFFYAAPLSSIWQVVSTRSCRSIHVPTMMTNTLNGAFWCAYGVAVLDPFIAVPNALGSLLGVVQIILCIIFPRRPIAAAAAAATTGDRKDGNESAPSTDEETGNFTASGALTTTTTQM